MEQWLRSVADPFEDTPYLGLVALMFVVVLHAVLVEWCLSTCREWQKSRAHEQRSPTGAKKAPSASSPVVEVVRPGKCGFIVVSATSKSGKGQCSTREAAVGKAAALAGTPLPTPLSARDVAAVQRLVMGSTARACSAKFAACDRVIVTGTQQEIVARKLRAWLPQASVIECVDSETISIRK